MPAPPVSIPDCPGAVTGFALWDSRRDVFVQDIIGGSVICQQWYKVNIEANVKSCSCLPIKSVSFSRKFGEHVENEYRYLYLQDWQGDILGRRLRPRHYVIQANPMVTR